MALELGDPVRIEMTKWGDRPHWQIPGRWLGSDEYGDWIAIPAGTRMVRPGADIRSEVDQVGLVPAAGAPATERGSLATFHAPGGPRVLLYIDITTPPFWDGPVVRAVDLDLDVVRGVDGRVWIEDEDEFAEHRVKLGYPDDIASAAETSCTRIHAAVLRSEAPYDGSHEPWLAALGRLSARS
jgi:uncharacterized protein